MADRITISAQLADVVWQARPIALGLIKPFESCAKLLPNGMVGPYLCAAGVPTQGWGIVVSGLNVAPITPAEADARLEAILPRYMLGVLNASPLLAAYPARLGALTSWAFNLGIAAYRGSTLRRRVNQADWDEAANEAKRWTRAGGQVLRGLVRRRAVEAEILKSGKFPLLTNTTQLQNGF